jgi:hypothetical protein
MEKTQTLSRNREYKPILMLLAISLGIRLVIGAIAAHYQGDFPQMYASLEPYVDYKQLYLPEVTKFLEGQQLYKDFFHAYPPLWIYTLSLVARLNPPFWGPAVPIVFFDGMLAPLTYLVARRFLRGNLPFIMGLLVATSPVILWYDGIFWLNPPPSTLFLLLSVYLAVSRRFRYAALSLAVAIAYKQTSIVALPFLIIGVYRWSSWKKAAVFTSIVVAILAVVSMPYLVLYPKTYLWALGVPGFPTPPPFAPEDLSVWKYDITQPTNLGSIFGVLGYPWLALLIRQYLIYALIAAFVVLIFLFVRKRELKEEVLVRYLIYAVLLFIVFFPRGTYKYFFVAALPLFVLTCRKKGDYFVFLMMNIGILVAPRFLEPWMAVLVIVFTYILDKENSPPILPQEDTQAITVTQDSTGIPNDKTNSNGTSKPAEA